MGAGAGILSLAAARLGAGPVLALDIAEVAIEETRENARLNGLDAVIDARVGLLAEVLAWSPPPGQPISVVANILTSVLESFLEQGLASLVSPDGWLILSGILRVQTPRVYAALDGAALVLRGQEQQDDWVCLVAQRA